MEPEEGHLYCLKYFRHVANFAICGTRDVLALLFLAYKILENKFSVQKKKNLKHVANKACQIAHPNAFN